MLDWKRQRAKRGQKTSTKTAVIFRVMKGKGQDPEENHDDVLAPFDRPWI
jgi:hypothetical protein